MSLRHKVLSGIFWTGGMRLLGQILTWAITIVVIRLLSPEDYGLLAMATVFIGLLSILAEAGLGAAVVQAPEVNAHQLRSIFGAVVLVNGLLFAVLLAAAPVIADFFDEPRLVLVIRILASQFLIRIFGVIPGALITRSLDFRRPSIVAVVGVISGSVCTLVLALLHYGIWALVIGTLVNQIVNTVAINILLPFLKWPDLSLRGIRRLMTFGGQVTAARILWFVYSQADIFIAGKLLGKELLGFYSVSMHLASLPVQKISAVINAVAFPAFAHSQNDPRNTSHYLLKALRLLSFVSFPVLWGISSIAAEIVSVLLGPKWDAAVVPLQLLSLVMPLNMVSPLLNTAFQGIGRSGLVLRNVLTACLIMPAAFWIGAGWGLLGLSVAWVLAFPFVLIINLHRMLPEIGLRLRHVLLAVRASVLGAGAMYLAVCTVRYVVADTLSAPALLALLIGIGIATYTILAWISNRTIVDEILGLIRRPQPLRPPRKACTE